MKTLSLKSTPLKLAFTGLLGAAAIISAPGQALAINPIVLTNQTPSNLNGTYKIGWITGTWASVGSQVIAASPWWGDTNLAGTLAVNLAGSQVFDDFPFDPLGPTMSTKTNSFTQFFAPSPVVGANVLFSTQAGGGFVAGSFSRPADNYMTAPGFLLSDSTSYTWAVSEFTPATPPAPGPLPLVGAAAAFGFSRRLRSRINKSAKA
jgi:hypothetical protein